jgi:pimeloyl-ACP methyl ester carboxylesterase
MVTMTTYMLVHGAWHTGECWERVAALLTSAGHDVYTPTLTSSGEGVGLETHVAEVAGLVERHDLTDVVLVGHSYAGLVVTSVLNEVPERIARLVYLDAMVPEDGETAVDVMSVNQRAVDQARDGRVPPMPELPPPYGLFGVTEPADVAWLRSMLTDLPVLCLQQKVRLDAPAARAVPRVHIHNTVKPPGIERRPVPPTQPNGDPSVVWELPTGHDCMVTMPAELSELLLRLTR